MEGLDPAAEDAGIARQGFHGHRLDAEVGDELVGAAGGIDGNPLAVEFTYYRLEAVFIKYRYECAFYLLAFHDRIEL